MTLTLDLKLPPSATVIETAATIKIARVGAFAVKNHAIMQVVGPTGSGKTVGVWSWLSTQPGNAVRIHLASTARGNEVGSELLTQLGHPNAPTRGKQIRADLREYLTELELILWIEEADLLNLDGARLIRWLWDQPWSALTPILVGSDFGRIFKAAPDVRSRVALHVETGRFFQPPKAPKEAPSTKRVPATVDPFSAVRAFHPLLSGAEAALLESVDLVAEGNWRIWALFAQQAHEAALMGPTYAMTRKIRDAALNVVLATRA